MYVARGCLGMEVMEGSCIDDGSWYCMQKNENES